MSDSRRPGRAPLPQLALVMVASESPSVFCFTFCPSSVRISFECKTYLGRGKGKIQGVFSFYYASIDQLDPSSCVLQRDKPCLGGQRKEGRCAFWSPGKTGSTWDVITPGHWEPMRESTQKGAKLKPWEHPLWLIWNYKGPKGIQGVWLSLLLKLLSPTQVLRGDTGTQRNLNHRVLCTFIQFKK